MGLIDEAKVFLKSGKGGKGCVSFLRAKYIDRGGPDGGNGGKGGNIVFISDSNVNTLLNFRYNQHLKAENGHPGSGTLRTGKGGQDLLVPVPVGTQIIDDQTGTLLYDFIESEQQKIILEGGRGGLGNAAFRSSRNRSPRFAQPGGDSQELWVWLKLKMLSDIGIIGMPNAGKSTFLSKVTNARPTIADYMFTTLSPQLGMVKIGDRDFLMADIPGLIEGAHLGSGLGHKFLKHIERCKVLIHLIDGLSNDVVKTYLNIRKELELYSQILAVKEEIICINKIDQLTEKEIKTKRQALKKVVGSKQEIFSISSHQGLDLQKVLYAAAELMKN